MLGYHIAGAGSEQPAPESRWRAPARHEMGPSMSESLDQLIARARTACARTREILERLKDQGFVTETRDYARHVCSEAIGLIAASHGAEAASRALRDERMTMLRRLRPPLP